MKKIILLFSALGFTGLCLTSYEQEGALKLLPMNLALALVHNDRLQIERAVNTNPELLHDLLAEGKFSERAPMTLLHYAVIWEKKHMVFLLTVLGSDVSAVDSDGNTPLHYAAQRENRKILKFLIANGAQLNARNKKKQTPLHRAVETNNLSNVTFFAEKNADVNARDDRGRTPFYLAVAHGYVDIVFYLYFHGAEVEGRDDEGNTPLYRAMLNHRYDLARFLIKECNADIEAVDEVHGESLLQRGKSIDNSEITQFLVWCGADVEKSVFESCIMMLSRKPTDPCIRILLENGVHVHRRIAAHFAKFSRDCDWRLVQKEAIQRRFEALEAPEVRENTHFAYDINRVVLSFLFDQWKPPATEPHRTKLFEAEIGLE